MAENRTARRGNAFLLLLRFTLLLLLAAFLAVMARTAWNLFSGG